MPVAIISLLMGLGMGVGFSPKPKADALLLIATLGLYPVIYWFCVRKAMQKYKSERSYGYWDVLPIYYFSMVCILLIWFSK